MRRLHSLVIHGWENLAEVILLGTCNSWAFNRQVLRLFQMVLIGVSIELVDNISLVSLFTSLCSSSRLALLQQYILRGCFLRCRGWHLILATTAVSWSPNPAVPSHCTSRPGLFVNTRSSSELALVVKSTIWTRFLFSNVFRWSWFTKIVLAIKGILK